MEIINNKKTEGIAQAIKQAGPNRLFVLADFDRTLTYGIIDGKKTPSTISLLRDGKHLTPEYTEQAIALYETYHVFENDTSITKEERQAKMVEWWQKHNELLIRSGLTLADLYDVLENGQVEFRSGITSFLDFLEAQEIPLIILSASGCGDTIPMYFEKLGRKYNNIFVVANRFNWDESGKAISTKGKVITSSTKSGELLLDYPEITKAIQGRDNIILMGDGFDDVDMVEGIKFRNIIKVGFLNLETSENTLKFKEYFDIIIPGDAGLEGFNEWVFQNCVMPR